MASSEIWYLFLNKSLSQMFVCLFICLFAVNNNILASKFSSFRNIILRVSFVSYVLLYWVKNQSMFLGIVLLNIRIAPPPLPHFLSIQCYRCITISFGYHNISPLSESILCRMLFKNRTYYIQIGWNKPLTWWLPVTYQLLVAKWGLL